MIIKNYFVGEAMYILSSQHSLQFSMTNNCPTSNTVKKAVCQHALNPFFFKSRQSKLLSRSVLAYARAPLPTPWNSLLPQPSPKYESNELHSTHSSVPFLQNLPGRRRSPAPSPGCHHLRWVNSPQHPPWRFCSLALVMTPGAPRWLFCCYRCSGWGAC